ncbi:MAG: hypothetical protein HYU25_16295 [Candidatus Rokubacteria bacterium]|nr:hypothetical protein [Candidatus Rokubacteria bacterium]
MGRCPNCWSSVLREGWLRRILRGLGLGTPVVIRTESITRTERIEVQDPHTGKVQVYDSLDKVPADLRAKIEQAKRDAGPAATSTKITVTDASGTTRTYDSVDEMPADIRQMYERAQRGHMK